MALAGLSVLVVIGLIALRWGGSSSVTASDGSGGSGASGASAAANRTVAGRVGGGSSSGQVSGPIGGARAGQADPALVAKARTVLAAVDATGRPPQGFEGGRAFMNDGRGGTSRLPRTGTDGRALTYREYDVNAYHPGVNRGPQRLVVASDGSAYCTGDHYVTWWRLRGPTS
jgi:hypothetical protein